MLRSARHSYTDIHLQDFSASVFSVGNVLSSNIPALDRGFLPETSLCTVSKTCIEGVSNTNYIIRKMHGIVPVAEEKCVPETSVILSDEVYSSDDDKPDDIAAWFICSKSSFSKDGNLNGHITDELQKLMVDYNDNKKKNYFKINGLQQAINSFKNHHSV